MLRAAASTKAMRVGRARTLAFWLVAVLVTASIGVLLGAKPAHANTFNVNSMEDAADNSSTDGECATDFFQSGTEPNCTLRAAIQEANVNGETDSISFDPALSGTITLTLGTLVITNDTPANDLSINGPGARKIAVSGNDASRVFLITSGTAAIIGRLSVSNGRTQVDGSGGGIFNTGTLELTNSTVSGNQADNGGGIFNGGTLTLNRSTVRGNQAITGGGIYSSTHPLTTTQKTTVTNSTISGNTASTKGGGIYNCCILTAIEHSTITNNTAPFASGGGVASRGITTARTEVLATIISANPGTDVDFVDGETNSFSSKGFNLIGDGTAMAAFNQPGDQSDVANPGLGSLANNGGPTLTHALLPGSPAIDLVTTGCPPPTTDQRGVARPKDGDKSGSEICDKGAYERSDTTPPRVTTTAPTAGQTGVRRNSNLTVTFSEKMIPTSITKSTFKFFLVTSNGTTQLTNVSVAPSSDGLKATLNPFGATSTHLLANTTYKAIVTIGAKDLAGNALDQNSSAVGNQQKVWTFTTGSI